MGGLGDVFAGLNFGKNFIGACLIGKRDAQQPHLRRPDIVFLVRFVIAQVVVLCQRKFVVNLLYGNFLYHELVKIVLDLLENARVFVQFLVASEAEDEAALCHEEHIGFQPLFVLILTLLVFRELANLLLHLLQRDVVRFTVPFIRGDDGSIGTDGFVAAAGEEG